MKLLWLKTIFCASSVNLNLPLESLKYPSTKSVSSIIPFFEPSLKNFPISPGKKCASIATARILYEWNRK